MNFNDYQKAIIERLKLQHGTTVGFRDVGDRSTERVLVFKDGYEWLTAIDRHTSEKDDFQSQFNGEVWVIWDMAWDEFLDEDMRFDNEFDTEILCWETLRERYDDHIIIDSMYVN